MLIQSKLFIEAGFIAHGFSTRLGGVSPAPFTSWNFSTSTGDSLENVEQNYKLLCQQLEIPRERLHSVHQVHSDIVVEVQSFEQATASIKADGLFTTLPGVAVGIKTADCVPILMADPISGSVAAVHAGWKGVVSGIAVKAMKQLLEIHPNAKPIFAIGPHIQKKSFQVGSEVAEQFPKASVQLDPNVKGKYLVDLSHTIKQQLLQAGLSSTEQIDDLELCTISDPQQRFFSHRGHKGTTGRMFNVIVATKPQT